VKHGFLALLLVVLAIGSWEAGAQGRAIRIVSENVADTRILIAVPDIVPMPGLEAVAKELGDVLRFDLTFTGLFNVAPRTQYPPGFIGFTQEATQIDFGAWRAARVQDLVHVCISVEGSSLVAQCRLFDTATGSQLVGQRLTTDQSHPRLAIHRFSEEIVRAVSGVPGIASSEICFSAVVDGKKEIFVSDYDGANVTQVTRHGSISIKPKFSPDGRYIAYLSYKDRYPFLYVFDRRTGASAPLSKKVGLNAAPSWSPDSATLAIVLSKDGNTEIYLTNRDGSGLRRLTNDRAGDTSPSFSPDGRQIAFVSDRGGKPQVYAMNADGSNVRRLSYQGGNSYDPMWSPDGKFIAYVSEKPGEGLEIYVMGADGSNARPLTQSQGSNESPSWSGDSRHVVFASTRSGKSELWAVTVETGEEFRLSSMGAPCQGPYWGPRRAG